MEEKIIISLFLGLSIPDQIVNHILVLFLQIWVDLPLKIILHNLLHFEISIFVTVVPQENSYQKWANEDKVLVIRFISEM